MNRPDFPLFSLPLTREQFAAALHKGQGRALMHVMRHGVTGFEDIVLDACLHDRRYDWQCEPLRTEWIMQIVSETNLTRRAGDAVVSALAQESGPDWSDEAEYRCNVAAQLAANGYASARAALYAVFQRDDEPTYPMAGDEIVELDGPDGLLLVAEKIGRWLVRDPSIDVSYGPTYVFDKRYGDGSADLILESAARNNDLIATYLDALRRSRSEIDQPSRMDRIKAMSADELIRAIEQDVSVCGMVGGRVWCRNASDDDLRQVADRMFRESDTKRLVAFLRVLDSRALPDFDARFLQLADHPDRDVRRAASFVLMLYDHPDARALALRCAATGRCNERQLKLFTSNYRAGDWALIRDVFRASHDLDHFHWLLSDLLDIYKANPGDEALEPLLKVYEETPCANCRRRSVCLLIDAGQAPDWLLEECEFDGDEYIRELFDDSA